jgi:hypothetical protein
MFPDPIKAKQKKNGDYPFEFKAPKYDERSSCYMKAGDDYGLGHKQPVGHDGNPKQFVSTLPQKSKKIDISVK